MGFSVAGVLAGVIGICVAIVAHQRAGRVVHECNALIQGSIGSRGTVDLRALRDVAVVRYDALQEMSGQLSFSLALLNALGDGLVLSSINSRSETRAYAKTVKAGEGVQELSPEESTAVRSARLGLDTGRPEVAGQRRRDGRANGSAPAAR
ncbi:MAG TPA: DUF4446 family protein [Trebonia sp.]|nr:DUF4446 family protein [Trebonia sp.]